MSRRSHDVAGFSHRVLNQTMTDVLSNILMY
jgi:hypothetical protein